MKILSSITYLHVVSNLYDFVSSVEYKIRYFEESSLTNIIHSIFLCVLQKNECIQVWHDMKLSKWQNIHFGMNDVFCVIATLTNHKQDQK